MFTVPRSEVRESNRPGLVGNKSGAYADANDVSVSKIDVKNLIHQEVNIYYDFTYRNKRGFDFSFDDAEGGLEDAVFNNTQNTVLIERPADYKLSCIRFEANTDNIPMLVTNDDYRIRLYYYPDNIFSEFIIFQRLSSPTGKLRPIYTFGNLIDAPPKVSTVPNDSDYGGINQCIRAAQTDLINQYEAIHGPGSWVTDGRPTTPPFITYDNSGFFTFYTDIQNYEGNPNAVQLYISPPLKRLFEGMTLSSNYNYYPYDQNQGYTQYGKPLFIIQPNNANIAILYPGTDPVISSPQQYQSIESWWKVKRLILVSDTIGVRSETISTTDSDGRSIYYNILTDFTIALNTTGNSPATQLRYVPTAEYRILDIVNDQPLTNINLKVYTQDVDGKVSPLKLSPGDGFSGKLLFTKSIAH